MRDLAPVTMAVMFPNVLVVHPSVQAQTLADFVKLAQAKPGSINYGSSGIGGAGHLAGELFRMMAKVDIVHVPYKGGGPAVTDLLAGQVAAVFATPASAGQHVKAGSCARSPSPARARSPSMPEVPTIAESGYPGLRGDQLVRVRRRGEDAERASSSAWNRELVKVLTTPRSATSCSSHGLEPQPGTREALAKHMERGLATWGRVVKAAGITAN